MVKKSLAETLSTSKTSAPLTEVENLTGIHTDLSIRRVDELAPKPFHKDLLTNVSDGSYHDIKDFLARPILVRSGFWSSTNTVGTSITNFVLLQDVINSSPVLTQKLSGFLGLRAKCVIRLQVNCNRFQQGRLKMIFFPQHDVSGAKYETVKSSLILWSQLPCIDFDAATDTEVIMEVPYVSTKLAFNMATGLGNVGIVDLVPYSALTSASSELQVEYNIWVHFEDVELFYPTLPNNSIVAQSGGNRKNRRKLDVTTREEVQDQEVKANGFLSDPLMKISKAAEIVAGIPLLSSVARPVSWAAAIGSKVASIFGFSKPLDPSHSIAMVYKPQNKSVNCDGKDMSYNFGLCSENHVEHLPGFAGNDMDELSLMYPLSIPTYLYTWSWSDTNVVFDRLGSIDLKPYAMGDTSGSRLFPTPVRYIGNLFRLYRGSFKFRIKFVKTEFHSGRLMFVYIPGYTGTPSVDELNLSYLHKEIVDIRDTTVVEFTCPWASTEPYLDVDKAYGSFHVFVLNQLRHPDTVLSSIKMLVEVSVASDFEFAVPTELTKLPCINYSNIVPHNGGNRRPRVSLNLHAQSGQTAEQALQKDTVDVNTTDNGIGTSKIIDDSLSSSRFCVGEKITSLRQLLKRATAFYLQNVTITTGCSVSLYPWMVVIPHWNTSNSLFSSCPLPVDYYSYITLCYGFVRGSVRVKSASTIGGLDGKVFYQVKNNVPTSCVAAVSALPTVPFSCVPYIPICDTVYPCPEVQVPYYSSTFCSHSVYDSFNAGNTATEFSTGPSLSRPKGIVTFRYGAKPSTTATGVVNISFTRQIGEDFSAGFWTGTLPLINLSDPQSPNVNVAGDTF